MDDAGAQTRNLFNAVEARGLRLVLTAAPLWPYVLLLHAVGVLHLLEVNLVDPWATAWIERVTGSTFTLFAHLEAPLYHAIEHAWTPERMAGLTAFYLVGFVALLAWTPWIVGLQGDRGHLKRVLLTYPLLYLLALPGYLFVPQPNPYISLGIADPFTPLHAGLEEVYYTFTTADNTLPSLHVAFTVALTVHLVQARPGLIGGAALVHGTLLVLSVVILRVHWIGDVLAGALIAWAVLELADRAARHEGPLAPLTRWLDKKGHEGARRALAHSHRRR